MIRSGSTPEIAGQESRLDGESGGFSRSGAGAQQGIARRCSEKSQQILLHSLFRERKDLCSAGPRLIDRGGATRRVAEDLLMRIWSLICCGNGSS